jgi:glutaredoxin 3
MLELYQSESCGACSRVRRKLDQLGLDWITRTVSPYTNMRQRVVEITGQPLVPVLVDPDKKMVVTESLDICDYLDENYSGRE